MNEEAKKMKVLGEIMVMITGEADSMEEILIFLTQETCSDEVDKDRVAAHLCALISMAQKIGWAADLGAGEAGSSLMKGDAENWFMHPVYHQKKEAAESVALDISA